MALTPTTKPPVVRADGYKTGYHAIERMVRTDLLGYQTMSIAAPAAADVAKAYLSKGVIKDALGTDATADVITSGVPVILQGNTVAFILNDTYPSETVEAIISADAPQGIWVLIDASDASNILNGGAAYMIPTATATKGGMVTSQATSGGGSPTSYIPCGRFLMDGADADVVASASSGQRPVGSWVKIQLYS